MIFLNKKYLLFLITIGLIAFSCNKDDNSSNQRNVDDIPVQGNSTPMSEVGNVFDIILDDDIDGVDNISVEVIDFQSGISTVDGSVEITDPFLSQIVETIMERFPEYGTFENNILHITAELKNTDKGISFVDNNNQELTIAKYDASVGDVYRITHNGKTYEREVTATNKSYYWEAGNKNIDVVEIQTENHDIPNLDRAVYYFNEIYGIVGASAFFEDGTVKSISIKSQVYNSNPNTSNNMGAPESAFNNNITYGVMNDIDGNTYRTVEIGNQIWMAENLYTTRLNDGTNIAEVETFNSFNEPGWYWFEEEYGFYYNKYAVTSGKLCPEGWRVPTKSDWETLASEVGDIEETVYLTIGRNGFRADGKDALTSTSSLWDVYNNFNNSSGFSILPNGVVSGSSGNSIDTKAVLWAYTSPDFYIFEVEAFTSDGLKPKEESDVNNTGYGCRCVKE